LMRGGHARFGIDTANMFEFWDLGQGPLLDGLGDRPLDDDRRRPGTLPPPGRALQDRPLRAQSPGAAGPARRLVRRLLGRGAGRGPALRPVPEALPRLPQQLAMESNGKHVTLAGRPVDYQTGAI